MSASLSNVSSTHEYQIPEKAFGKVYFYTYRSFDKSILSIMIEHSKSKSYDLVFFRGFTQHCIHYKQDFVIWQFGSWLVAFLPK